MITTSAKLRGITWEHPRGHGSMVAASARYRQLTGADVHWDQRSLQAFGDAPLYDLASEYDLLVIDHPHVPLAAQSGTLAPFGGQRHAPALSELAENSVGRSHASYAHRDQQWALACDAAAQVAAYRPDLLPEPPTEWTAVLDLARHGKVLWPAKPIDAYSSLITVAAGLRPEPTFLQADATREALRLLRELSALVPPNCLAQNPIQVAERLSADDQYSYAPLVFGYSNYSRAGFREHRLRYCDIPAGPYGPRGSLLGGAGIAVSSKNQNIEAAQEFALWVAGPEAQTGAYFDGGGQPAHALAWEDDRLNTETLDFFRGTRKTLELASLRPRTTGYMEFQNTIAPMVTDVLRGTLRDTALLNQIEQLRPLLDEVPNASD